MGDLEKLKELKEYIEQEIAKLEDSFEIKPVPYVPTPIEFKPNPRCSQCGLELAPIMGYVCPQTNCPSGLGGSYTTTNEPSDITNTVGRIPC